MIAPQETKNIIAQRRCPTTLAIGQLIRDDHSVLKEDATRADDRLIRDKDAAHAMGESRVSRELSLTSNPRATPRELSLENEREELAFHAPEMS